MNQMGKKRGSHFLSQKPLRPKVSEKPVLLQNGLFLFPVVQNAELSNHGETAQFFSVLEIKVTLPYCKGNNRCTKIKFNSVTGEGFQTVTERTKNHRWYWESALKSIMTLCLINAVIFCAHHSFKQWLIFSLALEHLPCLCSFRLLHYFAGASLEPVS